MRDCFGNKIDPAIAVAMDNARYAFPMQLSGITLLVDGHVMSDVIYAALNNLSLVLKTDSGSFTVMLNSLPLQTVSYQNEAQRSLALEEVGNNPKHEFFPPPPVHDSETAD